MKIGVYIENSGCYQVDCSHPSISNPGIGGTEYCLFLLAELCQKQYPQDQVYLFVNKEGKLPQAYKKRVANSLEDVLRQCREEAVDVLLIKTPQQAEAYALIQQYKIKVVVWGHNFYFSNICRLIAQTDYVRGNVFVGKQMYDRYIDDDICRKSTYIYNCCPNDGKRREENNTYHVTYIGSLVESKGFHVLAKHWKKILNFVPQAQLYVIGSGILYDKNATIKNNIFGTYNTADMAEKYGARKFILISTDKAVNPTSIMGATKRMCEMVIQCRTDSRTSFAAVRFGNVLGSNGSVIPLFKKHIDNGGPITITDKRMIRYFMTIPEASQLVMQAGAMAKSGELFVLDMGKPVRILDLAENMIRLSGLIPYQDIDIVEIGLRPGEKLYEELLIRPECLDKTVNDMIFIERDTPLSRIKVEEKLLILRRAITIAEYTIESAVIKQAMKSVVDTYYDPDEINGKADSVFEMQLLPKRASKNLLE